MLPCLAATPVPSFCIFNFVKTKTKICVSSFTFINRTLKEQQLFFANDMIVLVGFLVFLIVATVPYLGDGQSMGGSSPLANSPRGEHLVVIHSHTPRYRPAKAAAFHAGKAESGGKRGGRKMI